MPVNLNRGSFLVSDEAQQTDAIAALTEEVRKLNAHRFIRVQNSLWKLVMFQLIRGLAFGLGSVLGATILVSVLAWWLSQFEFVPIIGDWVGQISDEMKNIQDLE